MNLSAVAARVRVVAWILLLLLSLFPVLASVADLVSDFGTGLPADHEATFLAIAGQPWSSTQASIPAVAAYITLLETGYAIHELVFGILFLVIVAIPLRRGHWLHKASRRQARRKRALTTEYATRRSTMRASTPTASGRRPRQIRWSDRCDEHQLRPC